MPFFKKTRLPTTDYRLPTKALPPDTLLPLEKIIALAKKNGVSFGRGNPQERIRYFIKIGLLPHALRKSSQSKVYGSRSGVNGQLSSVPIAHLPYFTVERLIKI